jgi:hypothetical protein
MGAYISAAGTIIGAAQSILGGNAKDAERLAANAQALSAANAGNDDALAFLKQRTGDHGVAFVNGYGNIGGWATPAAKSDAKVKYQAALAARSLQGTASQAGDAIQNIAQQTGHTIVPGTRSQLAIVAVVLVLALVVFFKWGRR